jgi:hypothetical protein
MSDQIYILILEFMNLERTLKLEERHFQWDKKAIYGHLLGQGLDITWVGADKAVS